MGVQIPNRKGQFLAVDRAIEIQCESLLRCTQQKIDNGISATAAADCIGPDWPVSH